MSSLFQVVGGLALVLILLGGLVLLLKRLNLAPANRKGSMRVIESLALGPRDRLAVVQVGERRMLLGISPGRIQHLCELEGKEAADFQSALDTEVRAVAKVSA
ncbi:MAG: flagellar biosynthetic protein FliO [Gammaproteobacteria bacterium]|nr:flagellar biosynthetic protein FliO [Gammaproteobacteria bacterium]